MHVLDYLVAGQAAVRQIEEIRQCILRKLQVDLLGLLHLEGFHFSLRGYLLGGRAFGHARRKLVSHYFRGGSAHGQGLEGAGV